MCSSDLVIVKVEGESVSDSADLRSALRERRGRTFPLTIVRDRREQSVSVTLPKAEEPAEENLEESRYQSLIEDRVQKKMDAARRKLDTARGAMEIGLSGLENDI